MRANEGIDQPSQICLQEAFGEEGQIAGISVKPACQSRMPVCDPWIWSLRYFNFASR